jgi:hypothetical protein
MSSSSSSPLRFLFQIDSIAPGNGSTMTGYYHDWFPPEHTTGFTAPSNAAPWYSWSLTSVSAVLGNPPEQTVECNSTTLLWDFRTSRYYGVSTDCRSQDVATFTDDDHPIMWQPLKYTDIEKEGSHLTKVDFFGYEDGLGAPASDQWMPQLIPSTSALPPGHPQRKPGNAKLVGKISLLVALAALSCDFNNIVDMMRTAFRPPIWRHHDLGDGSELFNHYI